MFETPKKDTETIREIDTSDKKALAKAGKRLNEKYVAVTPENESALLAMRGLKKEGAEKSEKKEKPRTPVSVFSSMDYGNVYEDDQPTKTKPKQDKYTAPKKVEKPQTEDKPKPTTEAKNDKSGNQEILTKAYKDLGKKPTEGEKTIQTETKTKQEGNQENASKENRENGRKSPEQAIAEMREKLGKPYIRGGRGEESKGYDCSGLITTVLYPDDIRATSKTLYKDKSSPIKMAEVKTGDFIYQKGHIQVVTGPAVRTNGGREVPVIAAVGGHKKGYRQVREDSVFIQDGSKKYHAGRPKIFS